MKNTSKIVFSLSLVASLLAVSQVSSAATEVRQKNTYTFIPAPGQSEACKTAPAPVQFIYQHTPGQDRVLRVLSNIYLDMHSDANMKIGNTAVFTNTIRTKATPEYPLHTFMQVPHGAIKGTGTYWFWTAGSEKPCTGTTTLSIKNDIT